MESKEITWETWQLWVNAAQVEIDAKLSVGGTLRRLNEIYPTEAVNQLGSGLSYIDQAMRRGAAAASFKEDMVTIHWDKVDDRGPVASVTLLAWPENLSVTYDAMDIELWKLLRDGKLR